MYVHSSCVGSSHNSVSDYVFSSRFCDSFISLAYHINWPEVVKDLWGVVESVVVVVVCILGGRWSCDSLCVPPHGWTHQTVPHYRHCCNGCQVLTWACSVFTTSLLLHTWRLIPQVSYWGHISQECTLNTVFAVWHKTVQGWNLLPERWSYSTHLFY